MLALVSLLDSLFNPRKVGTIWEVTLSAGNFDITWFKAFNAEALTSVSLSFIKVQMGWTKSKLGLFWK